LVSIEADIRDERQMESMREIPPMS
jgi:hypothetical protein